MLEHIEINDKTIGLIFQMKERMTMKITHEMQAKIEKAFPNLKCILVDKDFDISVLQKEDKC